MGRINQTMVDHKTSANISGPYEGEFFEYYRVTNFAKVLNFRKVKSATKTFLLVLFIGGVLLSQEYTTDANTVALWHLNEGSGTTADDATSNNHDGTLINPTWQTSGKYGNAVEFASQTGRPELPNTSSLGFSGQVTMEMWVYPLSLSGDLIANKNSGTEENGDFLFTLSTNSVDFDWYTEDNVHIGPISYNSSLSTDIWSHVALALDDAANTGKIYINGNLDNTLSGHRGIRNRDAKIFRNDNGTFNDVSLGLMSVQYSCFTCMECN